ncbi:hypothetical protein N9L82_01375, partial [Alphaproteobacteria bacterium]|nr:hypothetical protein [Alphaproteobacteria bacterium]
RDPAGFILEHWTDGDLLTADQASQDVSIVDVIKGQYGRYRIRVSTCPCRCRLWTNFVKPFPG